MVIIPVEVLNLKQNQQTILQVAASFQLQPVSSRAIQVHNHHSIFAWWGVSNKLQTISKVQHE
jgi:hypothetical protein